jgi:molybdopterin-containing oxidoreductase family iron-sulfur binding subunit
MDESKRGFLKVAGCSLLGALGVTWARPPQVGSVPTGNIERFPDALSAKKWGMVVDTKKCQEKEGCTACIQACHRTHNVPEISNAEEEIKWIWKESYEAALPDQAHKYTEAALKEKPVLVFCNHCESAPCVRVCPTQATWKREEDGIVMMDQHRCIGCRYCMVACPYGSRSFNWQDPRPHLEGRLNPDFPSRTKGVVEKCNFCAERLAKGLMPVCVEACRKEGVGALAFGDLEDPNSAVSRILRERHSLQRKPALGTEPQVYYTV